MKKLTTILILSIILSLNINAQDRMNKLAFTSGIVCNGLCCMFAVVNPPVMLAAGMTFFITGIILDKKGIDYNKIHFRKKPTR